MHRIARLDLPDASDGLTNMLVLSVAVAVVRPAIPLLFVKEAGPN